MDEMIKEHEKEIIEGGLAVESPADEMQVINSLLENVQVFEKKYAESKTEFYKVKGQKIILEEKLLGLEVDSEEYKRVESEIMKLEGGIAALIGIMNGMIKIIVNEDTLLLLHDDILEFFKHKKDLILSYKGTRRDIPRIPNDVFKKVVLHEVVGTPTHLTQMSKYTLRALQDISVKSTGNKNTTLDDYVKSCKNNIANVLPVQIESIYIGDKVQDVPPQSEIVEFTDVLYAMLTIYATERLNSFTSENSKDADGLYSLKAGAGHKVFKILSYLSLKELNDILLVYGTYAMREYKYSIFNKYTITFKGDNAVINIGSAEPITENPDPEADDSIDWFNTTDYRNAVYMIPQLRKIISDVTVSSQDQLEAVEKLSMYLGLVRNTLLRTKSIIE